MSIRNRNMDLGVGWVRTRRTVFAAEEGDIYSIILHLLTPGRLFAPLATKRSHEYPSSVLLPEPDGDSTRFSLMSQRTTENVPEGSCDRLPSLQAWGNKGESHVSDRDSRKPTEG